LKGLRLISTTQSWHSMPLPQSGKSLRIPFHRPYCGKPRQSGEFKRFIAGKL